MVDLESFMPHGMCYMWRSDLLLLHVGSDIFIALAYFSIPAAMIVLIRNRPDIPHSIFRLFVAFIMLCGITHLLSIVVVWEPIYLIHGISKFATAVVSVITALVLWPLIPEIIALPSMSDLEQRNSKIESLNKKLESRMASLETLAGGVSHGFNNLLTIIEGNVELLKSSSNTAEEAERLNSIAESAKRAEEMCDKMLAYSAKGHFVLEEFDLIEYAEQLSPQVSEQIMVTKNYQTGIPTISASPKQVDQMVKILLENSEEAILDSGVDEPVISIELYVAELSAADLSKAEFEHNAEPGKFVVLVIGDNGKGMTQETRERLFDPFYSTKFTGRGLGMSALQGIVRGHEACLFVNSSVDSGTRVRIAFPANSDRVQQFKQPQCLNPKTVLLVDDEESILDVASEYLQDIGITPIIAASAEEAINIVKTRGEEIDAAILDYMMPDMTGTELLEKIWSVIQVDFYLSSGYNRGEIADSDQMKRITGFIAKPYRRVDFEKLFKQTG